MVEPQTNEKRWPAVSLAARPIRALGGGVGAIDSLPRIRGLTSLTENDL
jgi:hypothetical protein